MLAVLTAIGVALSGCAARSAGTNMMGGVGAQPTRAAIMSSGAPGPGAPMMSTGVTGRGSAMMTTGTPGPNPGGMMGGGMMPGAGSGYHYSTPSCAAHASLPGALVTVRLADMGMTQMMGGIAPLGVHMMLLATPSAVRAGKISLVAVNMGWRTHELVVLPLAAGDHAGQLIPGADGKVSETGSLGEASADCAAGSGKGITVGKTGWVTLDLAPGRYELVCNLANHYADGMRQELVVS